MYIPKYLQWINTPIRIYWGQPFQPIPSSICSNWRFENGSTSSVISREVSSNPVGCSVGWDQPAFMENGFSMPVGSNSEFKVVASKRIDFEKSIFWYMLLKSWFSGSGVAISLAWLFPLDGWVFDNGLSTLGGVMAVLDEEFIVAGEAFSEPEFVWSFAGEILISLTGHPLTSSNPGLGFALTELLLDSWWLGFGPLGRLGRDPKLLETRLSGEFVLLASLAFSGDEFIRAMCTQSVVSLCSCHTVSPKLCSYVPGNSI